MPCASECNRRTFGGLDAQTRPAACSFIDAAVAESRWGPRHGPRLDAAAVAESRRGPRYGSRLDAAQGRRRGYEPALQGTSSGAIDLRGTLPRFCALRRA